MVLSILSFCVLVRVFACLNVYVSSAHVYVSPHLIFFFFFTVDPVPVTEHLADTTLCDHGTPGVRVAGGLVWWPGLCAG